MERDQAATSWERNPNNRGGEAIREQEVNGLRSETAPSELQAAEENHKTAADDYGHSVDQDEAIVQSILAGTWSGRREEVEDEAMLSPLAERSEPCTFESVPVIGDASPPCTSCGHEFFSGDTFFQKPFPFDDQGERLCNACFIGRFPQAPPTASRSRSLSPDELEARPLHDDPQLLLLASQGGNLGGIRQYIQQEMQRLLGGSEPANLPETAALPPNTPQQAAGGRRTNEENTAASAVSIPAEESPSQHRRD